MKDREVIKEFVLYQAQFNNDLMVILEKLTEMVELLSDRVDIQSGLKKPQNVVTKYLNRESN